MACKKCGVSLPSEIPATYLKRQICKDCYNKYRSVNMDDMECRVCSTPLTSDNVYVGQGYICKDCFRASHRKGGRPLGSRDRVKRKRRSVQYAPTEDLEYEITEEISEETFVPEKKDDLYVMQNSRIPDEKKVGRSHDPQQRARDLGRSQNFRMQILKVYPSCGHLEAMIHRRLKTRRVTEGEGQEWFQVDLPTIDLIVQGAIAESLIQ